MRRARYNIRRQVAMTAAASLLVFWILQYFYSHENQDLHSQPNSDSQTFEREYALNQESESKSHHSEQNTAKPNIFAGDGTLPRGSTKVSLNTLQGKTPILIYPADVDSMISSRVRDFGTWEEDLLNATASIVIRHPGITFLDLGCNIGVYTLFMAKLGFQAVAVDPNLNNLKLLYESLRSGNLVTNVTLINNAVSDNHRNTYVIVPKDNVGGAYISDTATVNGNATRTITLNDLTLLLKDNKVFIKMDIEGHELRALSAGKYFFGTVDVRGILMEWVHHRYQDSGEAITEILVDHGFLPYEDASQEMALNPDRSHMWPENVFWFKR